MHPTIIAAVIIALGVVVAAAMSKGTYQIVADNGHAYRMHTGTGAVTVCRVIQHFPGSQDRNFGNSCADPAR